MIENAARLADAAPSDTLITILLCAPVLPAPGVPVKRPVAVSKVVHDGRLLMLKVNTSPSASLAVGTKLYKLPTTTCGCGVPAMIGAVLVIQFHADRE